MELLAAVEDYFDGRAVPALHWEGTEPREGSRSFSRFRLYANTLADVAPIERALRAEDVDLRTNAADIALVERLDRNLSAVYRMIAANSAPCGSRGFGPRTSSGFPSCKPRSWPLALGYWRVWLFSSYKPS